MYSKEILEKVLDNWDIKFIRIRDDISIAGSPERVDYRKVIEDNSGSLFIVEQIIDNTVEHKVKIAKVLEYFNKNKLTYVTPYLKAKNNEFLIEAEGSHWQLVEYVKGKELIRPDYIEEGWRGKVLAEFLISLKEKSGDVPGFGKQDVFSIKDYIKDMLCSIAYKPAIIKRLTPVLDYLEDDFFKVHDTFIPSFCHGDFHPVNVIWSENDIKAMIDWEFLGYKPEIYDAACMISCVGIEGPKAFTSALVKEFINTLKQTNTIEQKSWDYLLEYMIALRFGWISEWIRKDNKDMLEFDIGYTNAMVENSDLIKKVLS
jgi:homoserine kinase type II